MTGGEQRQAAEPDAPEAYILYVEDADGESNNATRSRLTLDMLLENCIEETKVTFLSNGKRDLTSA